MLGNAAEICKTPAGPHFRSCAGARRSPPVTANPVQPAAIPLMNQTTRHYPLRDILPLIGRAPAPILSKPSDVRRSFRQSLDLLVPSRYDRQHAILPMGLAVVLFPA